MTAYQIRVDGHLDDHWSERLGGLTICRNDDGTSTLAGPMADQAQLHGVLAGRDQREPVPGGAVSRRLDGASMGSTSTGARYPGDHSLRR